MAKHEKHFEAADEAQLPRREMLSLPGAERAGQAVTREDALVCFLSAEDGWVEAARRLGGAFASKANATNQKDIADR